MLTGKTSKSHKAKNSRDPEQSREEQPGSSKQKEPPKQDGKKGEYKKNFCKTLIIKRGRARQGSGFRPGQNGAV